MGRDWALRGMWLSESIRIEIRSKQYFRVEQGGCFRGAGPSRGWGCAPIGGESDPR